MKLRKSWLLVFVAVSLVAAYFGLRDRVTERLVRRGVAATLTAQWLNELPDGLNVVLCGAGGPMPDAARSGPCTIVVAGTHVFVVDSGPGSVRNIALAGVPAGRVEAAFLTHFHSDHIGELGELMLQRWIGGTHSEPLPVHGPIGVNKVVAGFNVAYALDAEYRVAHHGPKIAPPNGAGGTARPFALPPAGKGHALLDHDGLRVTAFAVDHDPAHPAVGYRFDYKGRSVVLSGDTRTTDNLVQFARGADLLVHEGLSPELLAIVRDEADKAGVANVAQIMRDVVGYHTAPVDAAVEAQRAGVRALLFYHVTPPLPLSALESIYLEGVGDAFDGVVALGRDGTWVSLPVGSDSIEIGSRR